MVVEDAGFDGTCTGACAAGAACRWQFGDVRAVGDGVSEFRIHWGPGYRVYFGRTGLTVVILLCGGDKRTQQADIRKAVKLWHEFESRKRSGAAGTS